jgi:NAD+ synthase
VIPTTRSAADLLALDAARETDRIAASIRDQVSRVLKRRGVVLGLSGGVDSSVAAALCVRALGSERVLGLLMPEADSAPETTDLGRRVGEQLGIRTVLEDVTKILEAAGCYSRRDAAIRSLVPQYGPGYRSKLVMPAGLEGNRYRTFSLVVETPHGSRTEVRLTAETYLAIVAATNFKQRVRKMMEYHYADRFQFAVVGTPNLLEYDQGFFVKNGDGAADLKPIAHLYKTQVYQLAEYLGTPEDIRRRPPTTDTFSMSQSQEEFFFSVPLPTLDVCLYGLNHGMAAADVAAHAGLSTAQVERIYQEIDTKRRATRYLHHTPIVLAERDGKN